MESASLPLFAAAALAALLAGALLWRLASRRHALPCPVWLRWLVELDNPFTRTNRAAFIVDRLAPEPGMAVLDAGCGPGRVTVPLARRVGPAGSVTAVDLQAGMLARAEAKALAAGLGNVTFVQAGLGEGRLERNRFHRAALVTVLGEIPQRERALAEIFAALRPGGLLAVAEVIFDPHFQRRSTVDRLAAEAGFVLAARHGNAIAYVALYRKPDGA